MNKLYISISEIKQHLNIDSEFTADDLLLAQYAQAAQEVIERNIDHKLEDFEDSYGALPESLVQAIRFMIANYYSNRESVAFAATHDVPTSYQYLIDLYRDYRGIRSECHKKCKEGE